MTLRHFLLPLLLAIIINGISYSNYVSTSRAEEEIIQTNFSTSAEKYISVLSEIMDNQLNIGRAMQAYFHGSNFVSREEFKAFTDTMVGGNSGFIGEGANLLSLNWSPKVTHSQRHDFEQKIRDAGFENFTITEFKQNNTIGPSDGRLFYFPLEYLEPFELNKEAFGFNINSTLTSSKSIKKLLAGEPFTLSQPIDLAQKQTVKQRAISVLFPVYQNQELRGVVEAVLLINNILNFADSFIANKNIDVGLLDVTENLNPAWISSPVEKPTTHTELYWETTLSFGSQTWKAIFQPSDTLLSLHAEIHQSLFKEHILRGLFLSFILSSALFLLLLQKSKAEAHVKELEAEQREFIQSIRQQSSQQLEITSSQLAFQQRALDEHAIVSITDKKGKIIYTNDKFEFISQYSAEELLGSDHRILNSGTHSRAFFKTMWQTIASGKTWHGDIQNKAKDGSLYWVSSTIVPYLNDKGEPEQYIALRTDITAVKQSNDQLNMTLRSTGDAVWEWNITTGSFNFSPMFETMLGYKSGDLETHVDTWVNSVHSDDLPYGQKLLKAHLSGTTETFQIEVRLKCKDGRWKWVLCRGAVISRSSTTGRALKMMGLHTDISDRKEMEASLFLEKESAEKANKAKSEFLSAMSHELRTPLNAILGFAQLLESDEEAPLNEDQISSINYIISSGEHLLTLVNDILELSAIEAGKKELTLQSISLKEIINDSLSLVTHLANDASVHIYLLSRADLSVTADYTKLKQIIINLVSNAIKYNQHAGSVSITWESTSHNTAKISIVDTGIGIPKQHREKLFSAFNRLGQEGSDIEGSGIGLVVTKDLIELMNGTIGCDSIENEGSTFWVELPLDNDAGKS
ncbi:MAG: hypothetical protein COA90_11035 [Gammaproteobacteria bacterium]|nr:MAG: hypothetical protein COA90_11035 [Gammaproteobacteria bacterium]